MERLIQFVMENIVFVVIIVGVISSLLSKTKGEGQPNQPGQPRRPGQPAPPGRGMPPFGQPDVTQPRQRREQPQTKQSSSSPAWPKTSAPVHRPAQSKSPSHGAERSRPTTPQPSIAQERSSNMNHPRIPSEAPSSYAAMTDRMMEDTNQDGIHDQSSPIYQALHGDNLQQQAIKGMVWAEILGSPRALKKRDLFRR